jgi:hypothetical protein
MGAMRQDQYWVAVVSEEDYRGECLYAHDALTPVTAPAMVALGDEVALVAVVEPPVLFGLGRVTALDPSGQATVGYTHRRLDHPVPVGGFDLGQLRPPPDLLPISAPAYQRLAQLVGTDRAPSRAAWLVSLALPIEAPAPGEAVREFWSYVDKLGPRELPVFVCPVGDELAMQAYVLGEPTDLDPEQDTDT